MKKFNLALLIAGLALQLLAQSPTANWTFHTLPGDGTIFIVGRNSFLEMKKFVNGEP